jgi:hypothetical protein
MGRVYLCVFIGEPMRMYVSVCVCIVFLKKKKPREMGVFSKRGDASLNSRTS